MQYREDASNNQFKVDGKADRVQSEKRYTGKANFRFSRSPNWQSSTSKLARSAELGNYHIGKVVESNVRKKLANLLLQGLRLIIEGGRHMKVNWF